MPPRTATPRSPLPTERPCPATELRTVGSTFAWLGGAQGVSMACAAAGSVLLARGLGDSGYGRLGFALSFAGLFAVLLDLGLPTLVLTEGARTGERARRLLGESRGALERIFRSMAEDVAAILRGEKPRWVVNPEALDQSA